MTTIRLTTLPGSRPAALGAAAALLLALGQPGAPRAAEAPLRLAMHDMMQMPMQQQGSPGGMGMMDDGMRMGGQQAQGGAGMGGMPGMGQPGGGAPQPGAAQPSSQPGQPGGMGMGMGGMGRGGMGMRMDDTGRGGMQGQPVQGGMGMGMPGMGGAGMPMDDMSRMMMRAGPHAPLDRIEGRLAFLRAELRVTDQQAPAWEQFAQSLRTARQHLVEARDVLQVAGHANHTPAERLAAYERHLAARLEGLRAARTTFDHLYGMLDEAQKRTAAELVVPFMESF
ncbi:Spy/CpxP family protein refolding chaperone [Roseicella aerolata]|uniref:Spy/CpxP family protein refolding chaperone n=1 Tax=Roseicella aerolata TaxID=2883479 RepID=A0A9X1LD57_9PROT|nr:Spy/CpxP family protein refolding chaperone [Roseicella aerolata]MCB4824905.1 Spy/CpxP family protein refolding chaperone [Roseicella aerolata]